MSEVNQTYHLLDFALPFEPELINEMQKVGRFQLFEQDQVILEYGQSMAYVPIVLQGSVKISRMDDKGNEILLYYVHAKESCAMTFTCCMQEKPSEIKAVALDRVLLLQLPITHIEKWLQKYATWMTYMLQSVQSRFNELLKTIDQIAFKNLDERLVAYLNRVSQTTKSLLINLSHEQIAHELGTSRVVISRLLKKLEKDKKVLLFRNQIKLLQGFKEIF